MPASSRHVHARRRRDPLTSPSTGFSRIPKLCRDVGMRHPQLPLRAWYKLCGSLQVSFTYSHLCFFFFAWLASQEPRSSSRYLDQQGLQSSPNLDLSREGGRVGSFPIACQTLAPGYRQFMILESSPLLLFFSLYLIYDCKGEHHNGGRNDHPERDPC